MNAPYKVHYIVSNGNHCWRTFFAESADEAVVMLLAYYNNAPFEIVSSELDSAYMSVKDAAKELWFSIRNVISLFHHRLVSGYYDEGTQNYWVLKSSIVEFLREAREVCE